MHLAQHECYWLAFMRIEAVGLPWVEKWMGGDEVVTVGLDSTSSVSEWEREEAGVSLVSAPTPQIQKRGTVSTGGQFQNLKGWLLLSESKGGIRGMGRGLNCNNTCLFPDVRRKKTWRWMWTRMEEGIVEDLCILLWASQLGFGLIPEVVCIILHQFSYLDLCPCCPCW